MLSSDKSQAGWRFLNEEKTGQARSAANPGLWQEAAAGMFNVHEASGRHAEMLTSPNLEKNAEIIVKILKELSAE